MTEAFPIVVYAKQLENKQRRITEIMECEILPDGERNFRSLYKFNITENKIVDGKFIINSEHEKVMDISKSMQRRLLENGVSAAELKKFVGGDES